MGIARNELIDPLRYIFLREVKKKKIDEEGTRLQRSGEKEYSIALAKRENSSRTEHDDQTDNHRNLVADSVDDIARKGVHEYLDEGLRGEQPSELYVLVLVVYLRANCPHKHCPIRESLSLIVVAIEFDGISVNVSQVFGNNGHDDHVEHVVEQQRHGDDHQHEFLLALRLVDPLFGGCSNGV